MEIPMIVSIGVGVLTLLSIFILYFLKRSQAQEQSANVPVNGGNGTTTAPDSKEKTKFSHSKALKSKGKFQPQKKRNMLESHPYLAANFKGHTHKVTSLSFDPNGGKYLASISDDSTVRIWFMKSLNEKVKRFRSIDVGYYDGPSCVAFSPDGKAVAVSITGSDKIEVYKFSKTSHSSVVEFSLKSQRASHVSLDIAANGSFIMMCNEKFVSLWSIKGDEELARITTNLSPNTCAAISPCSRFIACSGFTTSVKIYEVEFSKTGQFEKATGVMSLNGHSASVVSLQFSSDSKRVVTVSKDKTCRVWDIDVRYNMQEETHCLRVISLDSGRPPSHVALSPDGLIIAVSIDTSVWFLSCASGALLYQLTDVHNEPISRIAWDPHSLYLASAGGEDRYIRVWHNVPGLKEQLKNNEEELRAAKSEALKDRLRKDIANIRERLQQIEP